MYSSQDSLYRDFAGRFKTEFEAAETWLDFAKAVNLPERWHSSVWANLYFRSVKIHGYISRELMLPEVTKMEDLITGLTLDTSSTGWRMYETRAKALGGIICATHTHINVNEDGTFHARGGKGDYLWPYALFKPFALDTLKPYGRENYSLNAIERSDGKILLNMQRSDIIASYWLAIVEPFQITDFLSETEKQQVADYRQNSKNIDLLVGDGSKPIDKIRASALGVKVLTRKKPHWM